MRSSTAYGAVVALVTLMGVGRANADEVIAFHGAHPIAPRVHRGFCHIEGPHLHAYAPHKKVLYTRVGSHWHFIGDPTEYVEDDAPRHAYYGHHPLFWIDAETPQQPYCYISGPHHHWYAPQPELGFVVKGGVHWYMRPHPAWYKARRGRQRGLDRYYATVHLPRPVIEVSPPAGYVGFIAGPGGAQVHAAVAAPSVSLKVGLPAVGVIVGGATDHRIVTRRRRGVIVYDDDHPHDERVRYTTRKKRRGPPDHAPAWGARRKHRDRD